MKYIYSILIFTLISCDTNQKCDNNILSESDSNKIKRIILNDIQYYSDSFTEEELCYFKEYIKLSTFTNISHYNFIYGNIVYYFTCEHIGLYFSIIKSNSGKFYFLPDLFTRGLWIKHNEIIDLDNKYTSIIPIKSDHLIKVLNSIIEDSSRYLDINQISGMRKINFVNIMLEFFKNIDLNICDLCYSYLYKEMRGQSDISEWFKKNNLNFDKFNDLYEGTDKLFLRSDGYGLLIINYNNDDDVFFINSVSIIPTINYLYKSSVLWGDNPLELECDND